MLYVVDASSPEKVGAATIHLIDILEHSRAVVPGLPLMIVFRHINWIHHFICFQFRDCVSYLQCVSCLLFKGTRVSLAW